MLERHKKITIATHNSKFHTDDIFAVATLMLLLEKDTDITIVRTREKEIIDASDYVVDVGGEYDPIHNRFDHHQEGRAGTRENGVPYASIGLVWKRYGSILCDSSEIADTIDQVLIQPIDAGDNAVEFVKPLIENLYPYELHDFFHSLNPSWKEGMDHVDEIFMQAVGYAKVILNREIIRAKDKKEAEEIVKNEYTESKDKRLIIFDRYYPTTEILNKFIEPLFIVYPREDGTWLIQTIRDNLEGYIDRKSLPKIWAGKRGVELEKITGVPGSIFCHNDCFLAGAKTHEAILALAHIALSS